MSHPPFRADHVGSLLRPPELLRARSEREAGRISLEELRRVEDAAIRDVVRMQEEIGLRGVTDGEFRRGSWHMDFLYQIGGVAKTDQKLRIQSRNEAGPVEAALGAFRIGGKLPGLTVCTRMGGGNFRSSWVAEGGYDHVGQALFGELAVDGFFLEYDDDRSGGFEPLRFVPKGDKRVVLGLVTSKRAALESKDDLKRRIDAAAKYVPLEQLCLSPQCGFSSTVDGNALTRDEQVAKLRLVVETAREIWR